MFSDRLESSTDSWLTVSCMGDLVGKVSVYGRIFYLDNDGAERIGRLFEFVGGGMFIVIELIGFVGLVSGISEAVSNLLLVRLLVS